MDVMKLSICLFLFSSSLMVSYGRGWTTCTASCAKAVEQQAKKYDVVPLGYPYGKDWAGGPYLGPYAGPVREQFGRPFTFGYESVEGVARRKNRHCCIDKK